MLVNCNICNKEFNVVPARIKRLKNPAHICCSMKCRNLLYKEILKGENNPNYNNRWSEEQRKNLSNKTFARVDDEFRKNCSKGMKGKTFKLTEEQKKQRSLMRTGKKHSLESKKLIGVKSKEKFTKEFKESHRKTMEEKGYWIPLCKISEYKLYYKQCEWEKIEYYSTALNFSSYVNYGLYSGKTGNLKGVVRDHRFSRKEGFNANIAPLILKHPCNLEFLSNSDNISKGGKSSITLLELISEIKKYEGNYPLQNETLVILESYEDLYL